jgi:hypothetical protein
MSKLCLKCQKNKIPTHININGKRRNLCNRKYCLECSPFKNHNTKRLHCQIVSKKYNEMSDSEKDEFNKKTYNDQRAKRWRLKKELVNLKGSCCKQCGYNKNLAVLSFHHLNPESKEFTIDARSLISQSKESILKEIDKCQLLCMNCHQEIHYPQHFEWND